MKNTYQRGDVVIVKQGAREVTALFLGYHKGKAFAQAIKDNERIETTEANVRFQSDKERK